MRPSRDPAARRRLAALGGVALAAAAAGLAVGAGRDGDGDRGSARTTSVKRPSIERQVGELLVMSFDGPTVPAYIRRRLARGQGTGVILFARNAPDRARTRRLTGQLQRAAGGRAIIATDQERGAVRSLPFAGGGRDLHSLGVNVNLAPVADVATGPGSIVAGRAYPGDARAVAAAVSAAVRDITGGGVGATAKHFPGLGRAAANTDDAPVTIAATSAELATVDLVPFRTAIAVRAPLVMVSHALYPSIDSHRIASQSGPVIEGLLRRRLGFRGVVVTDSIEAEAVLARSSVAVAAERSVQAGADLILMTGSASWKDVQPRLLRRARRDARFRARIAESAARVRALKRRLGLAVPPARDDGR
jgi:beta-N-acetylhexosaminidase